VGERVVEFGAGVGAAGLALAKRVGDLDLTLMETDAALAAFARHNASANGIPARIYELDVTVPAYIFAAAGLPPDSADAVLMNPPFNDTTRHRASPDQARAAAHMAQAETLQRWIAAARRILKSGGVLTLIWRADGLSQALAALDHGFGSLVVLPVHGDAGKPAIRILIRALKGGRAPTQILPGLMLNGGSAIQDEMVAEILSGKRVLPLAIL
jgi:tRNA1(Val) A37 N6-methylase TrmN6